MKTRKTRKKTGRAKPPKFRAKRSGGAASAKRKTPLTDALRSQLTPSRIQAIVGKLIEKTESGDARAAWIILDRVEPTSPAPAQSQSSMRRGK